MNKEIVKSERLGESYSVFHHPSGLDVLVGHDQAGIRRALAQIGSERAKGIGKGRAPQQKKPYLPQSTAQFTTVSRPRTAKISSLCLRA